MIYIIVIFIGSNRVSLSFLHPIGEDFLNKSALHKDLLIKVHRFYKRTILFFRCLMKLWFFFQKIFLFSFKGI